MYITAYICFKFLNNDVFHVEVNKWNDTIFIILETYIG